jgi:nitrogen fixation/metabolism regulation signal transduction histidine kinase
MISNLIIAGLIIFFLALTGIIIFNFIHLLWEKKRGVLGVHFKTKLIVLFLLLSLLPSTVIFSISAVIILKSIDFWVNEDVKRSLEESLNVIRSLYQDKRISKEEAHRAHQFEKALQVYKRIELIKKPVRLAIIIFFVFFTFLLVNAVIFISFLFARKITVPLQELLKGTKEVARENLSYQIPQKKRKDEFGVVIGSFNQMIKDLARHKKELIYAQKVAAWKEIAQQLAHEIKNPLTPIKLCSERLVETYQSSPQHFPQVLQECTKTIVQEAEGLESLISEFSEFARIPPPELKKINLNEVIKNVLLLYTPPPAGVEIVPEIAPEPAFIWGDFAQLKRALVNLLKNAFEAVGEEGGKVWIRSFPAPGSTYQYLEIQDNGRGIPESVKAKIFSPHFSTKKKGMGLGLAIVNRIITEHHGYISLSSEPEKGTVVKIELPLWREEERKGGQSSGNPHLEISLSERR